MRSPGSNNPFHLWNVPRGCVFLAFQVCAHLCTSALFGFTRFPPPPPSPGRPPIHYPPALILLAGPVGGPEPAARSALAVADVCKLGSQTWRHAKGATSVFWTGFGACQTGFTDNRSNLCFICVWGLLGVGTVLNKQSESGCWKSRSEGKGWIPVIFQMTGWLCHGRSPVATVYFLK